MSAVWKEFPIGNKLVRNVAQINLPPDSLRQMTDVQPYTEVGSVELRRQHRRICEAPAAPNVSELSQQKDLDGRDNLVAFSRYSAHPLEVGFTYVRQQGASAWTRLWQGSPTPPWQDFPIQGVGDGSIAITPDAIRAFGAQSGWHGRLRLKLPETAFWRSVPNVGNPGPSVTCDLASSPNVFMSMADLAGQLKFAFGIIPATDGHFGFGVVYGLSLVYRDGQESPLVSFVWCNSIGTAHVSVTVLVSFSLGASMPRRISRIRVYRYTGNLYIEGWLPGYPQITSLYNQKPLKSGTFYLLRDIPIYKTDIEEGMPPIGVDDPDYVSWLTTDETWHSYTFLDKGEPLSVRFEDNQKFPVPVHYVSPRRRFGRVFDDLAFYWRVMDENGTEWPNRLYYSHWNGMGVHCIDTILPANYQEFPFEIVDVVQCRSYRFVIGDSGYAVGTISGPEREWQIFVGDVRLGCAAKQSIARTPYGIVFLGRDGLYVLDSTVPTGPIVRGIWPDIEHHPNLADAVARYCQKTSEYLLSIPRYSDAFPQMLFAVNVQAATARRIGSSEHASVIAMCESVDGGLLFSMAGNVWSFDVDEADAAENYDGSSSLPMDGTARLPVVETGYRHFFEDPTEHQQIFRLAVAYKSDQPVTVTVQTWPQMGANEQVLPASRAEAFAILDIPANLATDIAHAVRFEGPPGTQLFSIKRVFAHVQQIPSRGPV